MSWQPPRLGSPCSVPPPAPPQGPEEDPTVSSGWARGIAWHLFPPCSRLAPAQHLRRSSLTWLSAQGQPQPLSPLPLLRVPPKCLFCSRPWGHSRGKDGGFLGSCRDTPRPGWPCFPLGIFPNSDLPRAWSRARALSEATSPHSEGDGEPRQEDIWGSHPVCTSPSAGCLGPGRWDGE